MGGVRRPTRAAGAEEGEGGDSRIASDPDALEEWFSSMGGVVGPVALEGKRVGHAVELRQPRSLLVQRSRPDYGVYMYLPVCCRLPAQRASRAMDEIERPVLFFGHVSRSASYPTSSRDENRSPAPGCCTQHKIPPTWSWAPGIDDDNNATPFHNTRNLRAPRALPPPTPPPCALLPWCPFPRIFLHYRNTAFWVGAAGGAGY